jgi:uncharacterized protein YggE
MKNSLFFTIAILLSTSVFAEYDPQPRQVAVSGECNHVVSPDRGSITLTVEFQNMDLAKATKDAADSYERLSSAIKKLRLENLNIRTNEYSVNEVREWEKNREIMKGYRARMGLWVSTSEIQKIGEIIAIASKEKVKDVNSLQTYLSDEKQLQEEVACLGDAAKNARVKAEKLASALGAKIGGVMQMNETGRSLPQWPRPMMNVAKMNTRMMAMDSAESAPSVEAGQQNLSLSVLVTFELK